MHPITPLLWRGSGAGPSSLARRCSCCSSAACCPEAAHYRPRRPRQRRPAHRHLCRRRARTYQRHHPHRSRAGVPVTAPRLQGSGTRTSCTRRALTTQPNTSSTCMCALCMLSASHPRGRRYGAAPTSSSLQTGGGVGAAALCGESRMRAGRAHETRPSPRPRPSAKPQARGSALLRSWRAAAPQAPGVSSTLNWSGAPLRHRNRRRQPQPARRPPLRRQHR